MASTYLTPTAVTRAIAAVLHQKGNFINRINRQYDAQYADNGQRKGGGTIKIRMPNMPVVRTGVTMNVQDLAEKSETLTIGTMKGLDLTFTDTDLALSIEDFTERFITPSVAVLVSAIEADIIDGCTKAVAQTIDADTVALSYLHVLQARQRIMEMLAPDDDDNLSLFLSPTHATKFLSVLAGLYHNLGGAPAEAYRRAIVNAPVAGVGFVGSSTHLTNLTTGTAAGADTTYDTDIALGEANGTTGSTGIHIDTGSGTFKVGDIFTIESVNACHPETKADLGYLKQFSVLTNTTAGTDADLPFYPISGGDAGIVSSGGRQNVYAAPADGKTISKACGSTSAVQNRSLYFHRDFAAVAFADLENPKRYGAWGDTQVVDGISVRLWRQGDIVNGTFPVRLDVLYGYKVIRPQLACRIHADG